MSDSPIPPPPKRTVAPTAAAPKVNSFWERSKNAAGTSWNGLYGVADTLGSWSNKQSAKLGAEAFYPTSLDLECDKAARILRTFTMDAVDLPLEALEHSRKTQKVIRKIPPEAIANCAGLAIFTVMRTGFMISGAGGSGIVVARLEDGSWSAPSGILLHTVGVGFMIGADVYDVVLILRNKKAVDSFSHPRVSLGGEISITAGPVGNGFMLESGIDATPVWSYQKSKGFYGGVQLDGNVVIERPDESRRSYGYDIKASAILSGGVKPPHWCEGLHQTIRAAEGKTYRLERIPVGCSPSELLPDARRLPPEDLDADDLAARQEMEEAMRNFGIDDPTSYSQSRGEDPLLLQGPDLELLSTPNLSNTNSPSFRTTPSSPASSIRPLSLEEAWSSPLLSTAPPNLPPRKSVEIPSSSQAIDRRDSGHDILSEVIEQPPVDAEEVVTVKEEKKKTGEELLERSGSPFGEKPKVPPRRRGGTPQEGNSPITPQGPFKKEKEMELSLEGLEEDQSKSEVVVQLKEGERDASAKEGGSPPQEEKAEVDNEKEEEEPAVEEVPL